MSDQSKEDEVWKKWNVKFAVEPTNDKYNFSLNAVFWCILFSLKNCACHVAFYAAFISNASSG